MAAEKRAEKGKRKSKVKEPKKKSTEDADDFNLKDVLDLGGSEEDYERLKNLATDGKQEGLNELGKDLEKEIKDLVKSIGFDEISVPIGDVSSEDSETEEDSVEKPKDEEKKDDLKKLKKKSKSKDESKKQNPTEDEKAPKKAYIPTFTKHGKSIIKLDTQWHEQIPSVENTTARISSDALAKLKDLAEQLWENEVSVYQEAKAAEKSSDAQWLRTVLTSGTQSDKVAAITMLFQEAPVHQVKRLESLIAMSKKRGRREAIMAIDSLRSLLVTDIMPERKLKHFWQWPLDKIKDLAKDSGKIGEHKILILWYFEDLFKEKYSEFVESLERMSHDTVPDLRNKATGTFFELLVTKPEQEQKLLNLIVNKLGDPVRKVASSAIYLLTQLVIKHPNMKLIVIEEVERLLYRPNVSPKTQYYAICFLNQIIISSRENAIASKLISIYFSFFKVYATKRVSETKMLSALLTGVNRAFPYAQGEEEKYDEQLNMLFRVCHVDNFQTNIQALMLLFQVMDSRKSVSDRYYQVLYEKLSEHGKNKSSRHSMFLNLIYKSIKADPSMNRIKAFLKRLLQVSAYEEPSFICGLLYLISEVLKARPGAKSLTMQPEEEDDEENFKDLEEETFTAPNESAATGSENSKSPAPESHNQKTGWTFRNQELKTTCYDINNRNPLYCGAQLSCAWEIHPLLKHFHPSVSHFANSIIDDQAIEYKGDPLQDFTLSRFLDRFMYKNPKKSQKDHGHSIMQPKKISQRSQEQPVNSKAFTNRKEENIREDELFFYRYFTRKSEIEASKKGKKKKGTLEDEFGMEEEDDVEAEDFDFAGEMQRAKNQQPKNKKKRKAEEDDENNDDDDDDYDDEDVASDSGEEFQYDDMDFSEDEDFEEPQTGNKKEKFSDADYEKALLENLSDSGEELDEDPTFPGSKTGSSSNLNSMFAAADEFSHLLEDVGTTKGQRKQASWENRGNSWSKNRQQNKRFQQNKSRGDRSSNKTAKTGPKSKLNHGKRRRTKK